MLSQWDVCDVVSHLNTKRNLSKRKRTNEFAEINGHFVPKNSCSQNSRLEWWRRLYQKEWFYLIERKYLEHSTLHECVLWTLKWRNFFISFAWWCCVVGTCTLLILRDINLNEQSTNYILTKQDYMMESISIQSLGSTIANNHTFLPYYSCFFSYGHNWLFSWIPRLLSFNKHCLGVC